MSQTATSIANRLIRTRMALGYQSQAEFAAELGLEKNVYNPFERGKRRLTLAVALKIKAKFGISLDWMYCGDISSLPASIYKKISLAA